MKRKKVWCIEEFEIFKICITRRIWEEWGNKTFRINLRLDCIWRLYCLLSLILDMTMDVNWFGINLLRFYHLFFKNIDSWFGLQVIMCGRFYVVISSYIVQVMVYELWMHYDMNLQFYLVIQKFEGLKLVCWWNYTDCCDKLL